MDLLARGRKRVKKIGHPEQIPGNGSQGDHHRRTAGYKGISKV